MTGSGIRRELRDEVMLLELARGKGNTLDVAFLRGLRDSLREIEGDAPRGLVLTAQGNVFSAGLDLFALESLDRAGMEELLSLLYECCRSLFVFPRPVVAAMNGHAIAGGLLLALSCDVRLMAQGDGRLGLSESSLGLPVPAHSIEILRYALSRRIVEKLCYGGQVYPAFKVLDMEIVDELIEGERLIPRAIEWVREWTPSTPATFAANKARLKAHAIAALDAARAQDGEWLDLWFHDETRKILDAARARLRERNA